jgi:hypothetical protein
MNDSTVMGDAFAQAGVVDPATLSVDGAAVGANVGEPVVSVEGNVPATAPQDNQPQNKPSLDTFAKEVAALGAAEGKGINARPSFMLKLVEAAQQGVLKEDDAEALFDVYQKGLAKAKGQVVVTKQTSAPQQVSKIRTMIKLGLMQLPEGGGEAIIYRTGHAIAEAIKANDSKPLSKSAVDCYLSAARMQLQHPEAPLTDDEIISAIMPKPRDEKLEVDKLGDILAAMDALNTDTETPPSEETASMLEDVMGQFVERIKALGGTSKQKAQARKAEEKAAKAEAKAAKAREAVVALRQAIPGGVARFNSRG